MVFNKSSKSEKCKNFFYFSRKRCDNTSFQIDPSTAVVQLLIASQFCKFSLYNIISISFAYTVGKYSRYLMTASFTRISLIFISLFNWIGIVSAVEIPLNYDDSIENFFNDGRLGGWSAKHIEDSGTITDIRKGCFVNNVDKNPDQHCLRFTQVG